LYTLTVAGQALYAGLDRGLVRWDGTRWQPAGGTLNGGVDAIAVVNGTLYVGGRLYRCRR
jgi:hypothetical protein